MSIFLNRKMIEEDMAPRGGPQQQAGVIQAQPGVCLLYTSPSPRDRTRSRMPSSA